MMMNQNFPAKIFYPDFITMFSKLMAAMFAAMMNDVMVVFLAGCIIRASCKNTICQTTACSKKEDDRSR
jgi:hypothetical protein